MKKDYYVLTENQQDADELFAYLKANNYTFDGSFQNWENPDLSRMNLAHRSLFHLNVDGNVRPVSWDSIMTVDIESYMSQAISVHDTKMLIGTLKPLEKPVELNDAPRKTQKELEQELGTKPQYRQAVKFAKITEGQIVAKFNSKDQLDQFGNPMKLCKIVLPRPELSAAPILVNGETIKYSTIVVPEFIIKDDKFSKEVEMKLVSLWPDYQYTVSYPTQQKNEKGYTVYQYIKVSGSNLLNAFKYADKHKDLDSRLNEAKSKKVGVVHEEAKNLVCDKTL